MTLMAEWQAYLEEYKVVEELDSKISELVGKQSTLAFFDQNLYEEEEKLREQRSVISQPLRERYYSILNRLKVENPEFRTLTEEFTYQNLKAPLSYAGYDVVKVETPPFYAGYDTGKVEIPLFYAGYDMRKVNLYLKKAGIFLEAHKQDPLYQLMFENLGGGNMVKTAHLLNPLAGLDTSSMALEINRYMHEHHGIDNGLEL